MSTTSLKPAEVEKKWVVIDASGLVVGRLASVVAMRLRGKHKAAYTPHVDCGDNVIVINADKVVFTWPQARAEGVLPSHRLSGRHQGALGQVHPRRPLPGARRREGRGAHAPRGPLFRQIMGNLRVYKGAEHPHVLSSPSRSTWAPSTART
jgi:large subunit ribosomal protein L13